MTTDGLAGADDGAVLQRWWDTFVATGTLPPGLELVQTRLVRAVNRGDLPSGPVYVKTMTFPRAKDRLRYLLRALPGAHEARMLGAVAAAGIPCPEVMFVRTARRFGLPFRSLLVLRALSTGASADPARRLSDEAAVAARLLARGIVHHDLHSGNFVELADGRLAVLDMQSAACTPRPPSVRVRMRVAARLLQDRPATDAAAATTAFVGAGLLGSAADVERVLAAVATLRARFVRTRIRRCLGESTEFTRRIGLGGVEHRARGELPPGTWRAGRDARRVWLGQRVLQVLEGRPPVFPAFLHKWWWLGGGGALYVPAAYSEDRIDSAIADSRDAYARSR